MNPTWQPEYCSQRHPEYVAWAYLHSLWRRRVRGGAYDEPLVFAFMDLLEAPVDPDKAAVNQFYWGLVKDIVVPEARRMREFASPSPLRNALGIDGQHTFTSFVSTLLFLREASNASSAVGRHFNQCWVNFPTGLRESVEYARAWQLRRLRFHLMPHKQLRFLASLRLVSENGEMDPVGYGAQREGRVGYSHFAREVALFAFLDELFEGAFLDAVARLAPPPGEVDMQSVVDPELDALFDYVLVPVAIDLAKILIKRRTWRPDSAVKSDPKSVVLHMQNASFGIHNIVPQADESNSGSSEFCARIEQILNPEQRSGVPLAKVMEELRELRLKWSWVRGADIESLDEMMQSIDAMLARDTPNGDQAITLGEFRMMAETGGKINGAKSRFGKNPKSLGENKDAERTGSPLLEDDPRVRAVYEGVVHVIEYARATAKGGLSWKYEQAEPRVVEATLEEMLCLWFGLQLLSMLKDRRYPANATDRFLADLKAIFSVHGDETIGDALAVAEYASDGKQIFGERFVTKRNQLVDSALAEFSSTFVKDGQFDVVHEHLTALKTYEAVIGPVPSVRGKGAMSLIGLNAWTAVARLRANGRVAELESLCATLQAKFKSQPCNHLSDGFVEVASFLKLPAGVGTGSRNGLQGARALLERLATECKQSGFSGSPERLRTYLIAMTVIELIEDCLAIPDAREWSLDVTPIRRFFSQKYAKDLEEKRGEQEAWLYIAFKLANTQGFETYRDVYERVSQNVGTWQWGGSKLSALYHDLVALDGFQQDTRALFESLFPVQGDPA